MNDRESRRYEMFNRVRAFGQDYASEFPAGSRALAHFAALTPVLTAMDQARANQLPDGSTTSKAVLLDALRLDLANINRTARAIALDEPGFAQNFRLPEHYSQGEILAAADAILARLEPNPADAPAAATAKTALAAKFIAYELPADFIADLAADRAAVVAAQEAQDRNYTTSIASTASLSTLIANGLREVTSLDAIMHNKFSRQPEKLRAWQSASRTERAPQREKPATPSTPTAPAST